METQTLDEVLEHYGVLGMKWGVRRSDKQLAKARNKKIKGKNAVRVPVNSSDDHINSRVAQKKVQNAKSLHVLSNKELQDLNNRLNLEQQYSRLSQKNASKVKKGGDFAKSVLVEVGKKQAISIVNKEASRLVKKAIVKR